MSEEAPTPDDAPPGWAKALSDRLDALTEAAKPKPAKSDRDVLDAIEAGLTSLGKTIGDLLKNPLGGAESDADGSGGPPPPPRKSKAKSPAPETAEEPKKRSNPWTRHLQG